MKTKITGQMSDTEFRATYPNAHIKADGTATTRYGMRTVNYWLQHPDKSWTNYDCKTL